MRAMPGGGFSNSAFGNRVNPATTGRRKCRRWPVYRLARLANATEPNEGRPAPRKFRNVRNRPGAADVQVSRLNLYLTRLFFSEALALTAVVVVLLYLVQCLRITDVITVKGQDILTLLGQAALIIPLIGAVFLYVCVGIGLARALTALQDNGELHIIHSSRRLSGLFQAIGIYAGLSALAVLALSHIASPTALRSYDEWAASIASDLVGRALVPHRFVEVVPGVTVVIESRQGEGQITDFFADDQRDPKSRRTYSARSAVVARDDQGYVLQMQDGSVQYMTGDLRFSEIKFSRYDLAVELLTQERSIKDNSNSIVLLQTALQTGVWSEETIKDLVERSGEGLRIIGMCLLVAAIAAFPSGRRRSGMPLELLVLVIAFADRGLSTYAPEWLGAIRPATGALAMIVVGALVLAVRLWVPPSGRWAARPERVA
jgi:lipopolysaccharide export system permease protein